MEYFYIQLLRNSDASQVCDALALVCSICLVLHALTSQGIAYALIKESELTQTPFNPETVLLNYGFQDAADHFFAGLGAPTPVSSLA